MKVVVVGAGVIGLFCALELARQGAQVTVVDQGQPGGGATAGSFGWINASFAETDAYYELRRKAVEAWATSGFGEDSGLRLTGALWWEDAGADFDAQARDLARRGWDATVVGPDQIARIEPALAAPPDRAIHTPREGAVDSPQLVAVLVGALQKAGARIVTGPRVAGILRRNGTVNGVTTDRGDLTADRVVLALGGGTGGLPGDIGIRIDRKPGLILHTNPVPPFLNGVLMTPGIHVRQSVAGHLVVGEIFSGDGPDPDRTLRDPIGLAQEMMERLRDRLPAASQTAIARIFAPSRPMPPDGLPIVGEAEPGLYLAAMHSGITLAPLIGRLVATEVMTSTRASNLAPFRPDRFG